MFSGGISAFPAISGAVNAFKIAVATSFRTAAVRLAYLSLSWQIHFLFTKLDNISVDVFICMNDDDDLDISPWIKVINVPIFMPSYNYHHQ